MNHITGKKEEERRKGKRTKDRIRKVNQSRTKRKLSDKE